LVPIEAASLGVPSICFGKGEVVNIMKSDDNNKILSFFYKKQNSHSLNKAINEFLSSDISVKNLKNHAKKFSGINFRKQLTSEISKFMANYNEPK